MTTDSNETAGNTTVRDGTTTPGNPIPRDPESVLGHNQAPEISVEPPAQAEDAETGEDAVDAGQSESSNPPGPAEEKDNATADHRGLTTETNPTD